jgi:AraC-like DNA-binding protein
MSSLFLRSNCFFLCCRQSKSGLVHFIFKLAALFATGMNQKLHSLSHGTVVWAETLPPAFRGIRLPGGIITSGTGEFGSLCIQEFIGQRYTIRFNAFDVIQRFILRIRSTEIGLHTRILLRGHVDHEMEGAKQWSLRRNQIAILNAAAPEITEYYNKNFHTSFDTFFSRELVDELLPLFPQLGDTFSNENSFLNTSHWADGETMELVQGILRCKYEKELRRHYFESRVRDLLFKFLVDFNIENPAGKQPNEKELAAVYEAEKVITNDISAHFTIDDLSRKVSLNEFRLKILFKKIFGMGPYEYLIRERMKRARELLESGYSVKEVTARIGYRPTDFTVAFINYYGFPPSAVKKKGS